MRHFSLYEEMRLCSAVNVASFPASSEQSTNSVCFRYKSVTANRYRSWYRLQYRRYRYQTDTTGIGPIPILSTGIGLSLECIVAKWCILEQKLLLRAYRVACEKSIGTKLNDLDLCLDAVSKSWQPLLLSTLNIWETVRDRGLVPKDHQ